jgi:hypothetical protein
VWSQSLADSVFRLPVARKGLPERRIDDAHFDADVAAAVWVPKLRLVQDPAADALLDANPFALLVGMLLHQQWTMLTGRVRSAL